MVKTHCFFDIGTHSKITKMGIVAASLDFANRVSSAAKKNGREQRRRKMGAKSMLRTFIENQNKKYEGILSLVDK